MILSETELVSNIGLLKDLREQCEKMERDLKSICSLLHTDWNVDMKSIGAVQKIIEQRLLRYRAELSEARGE